MKYVFEFMTQTQLGVIFGTSSHKIGAWLKEIGLRNKFGQPTQEAITGAFCKQAPSGPTAYHWVWNSRKTVKLLMDNGFAVVPNPPRSLVHPAILNGPFSVQKTSGAEFSILNKDGSVSLWANNDKTANVMVKILNAAHSCGVIDRLVASQRLLQMPLALNAEISTVITPFDKMEESAKNEGGSLSITNENNL